MHSIQDSTAWTLCIGNTTIEYMPKIKAFLYVFQKSISSFSYYREIVKTKFLFSFKYFFSFSLFLALVTTFVLSLVVLPPVSLFINRFQTRAEFLFPADLVLTVHNGKLSTNAIEPLRFPIPFELFTDTPGAISDQNQEYLVTIDTNAGVDAYKNSRSLIFVTGESLVVGRENEQRIYSLQDFGDVVIDKTYVTDLFTKINPWLKLAPFILVIFFFLTFALVLPIMRLFSLCVLTLILLCAAKLMKINIGYQKLFQIGLHALTLPTLIQIAITAFNVRVPIPFFYAITYLLLGLVILTELQKVPALKSKKG